MRGIDASRRKCAEITMIFSFSVCAFWCVVMVLTGYSLIMHAIFISAFGICVRHFYELVNALSVR